MMTGSLVHFPALKKYRKITESEANFQFLAKAIEKIKTELADHFHDFRNKATIKFLLKPLQTDMSELIYFFSVFPAINQDQFYIELVDL